MGLNKQSGNMYGFVTHTWNPIKGRCAHGCSYCYMHRFWGMMKNDSLRLDRKELRTNLGEGNFIFVGSSTDMWGSMIYGNWIEEVLNHVAKYPKNTYLFQTKNPHCFSSWWTEFTNNHILGVTLETNRLHSSISKVANPIQRVRSFIEIEHPRKIVTIEPIMDFDLPVLVAMVETIKPEWVNIGADSGHNNLPEPSKEKVLQLITELEKFTKIHQKPNLKRLLK